MPLRVRLSIRCLSSAGISAYCLGGSCCWSAGPATQSCSGQSIRVFRIALSLFLNPNQPLSFSKPATALGECFTRNVGQLMVLLTRQRGAHVRLQSVF